MNTDDKPQADNSQAEHQTDRTQTDRTQTERTQTERTQPERTHVELEAAVYRRLVQHLRNRTDVQNIDLMILAGFCRNCLSDWMREAAHAKGVAMTKEQSREIVYGMPYDEWRTRFQHEATPEQTAAFKESQQKHPAS
jgi:uncharacterized protein